jgi:DNA replication protein DnaC
METTQILERMKQMKLFGMQRYYQGSLDAGHHMNYTADELLTALVEAEWDERQTRKIDRLMRLARFRYKASIEEIAFNEQRNLDKNQILRFAECDFIRQKQNILITGSTGVGKSFLACAIGHQACFKGYRVMYFNIAKILARLKMQKADGSYMKEMSRIEKQDLVILDDFGLQPIDSQSWMIFLEMMEDRYDIRSTIVTSQLPVSTWHEVIIEKTIADAIMDRLVHSSHRIDLKGESMRKKQKDIKMEMN